MYTLNLLAMAFELAKEDPAYERCRQQVLGTLPLHRQMPLSHHGHDGHSMWNKEGDSSTTCCICRTVNTCRSRF